VPDKTRRATQGVAFAALFALSALAPLAEEAAPVPVSAASRVQSAGNTERVIASKCVEPDGRTSYVDADAPCAGDAMRHAVVALAGQNVTQGMPPEERAHQLRGDPAADADSDRQCAALDELVRTIDIQVLQGGPAAARDQLRDIRERTLAQQRRLAC
jgi:hypothetical protein